MFARDALFGNRGGAGTPPQRPPQQRPQGTSDYRQPQYTEEKRPPQPQSSYNAPSRQIHLQPINSPNSYTFFNLCAVNPQDIAPSQDGDPYLLINGAFVVSARPSQEVRPGQIGLNKFQRAWMRIALTSTVTAEHFDPFSQGAQAYLGNMDLEIGFAGSTKTTEALDQDALSEAFTRTFKNQIFAPGQDLLMDFRGIPCKVVVRTVELVDLSALKNPGSAAQQTRPQARGIVTPQTGITWYKDANSPIKISGSTKRPAANAIIRPDFKFEDMGIGGLDKEFSAIFRRAFASRLCPPGLWEKFGIDHVRGILLYGPPGTGKTLIARQIGKMLNAREPKIINGPEVLNKYVGQSEENIRKMFADAEKEQKEKGDESGLHIIIFDELDAVCKQRGSGAGGGTGVGDSVVNQLLSKLDGVEQLNNILLIGMTNRKDMIDEALLRPGRLEVHMEISLPDEAGRQQILKIHTAKLRKNGTLSDDVNIPELAHRTRNFSGAEINGVVKAASSFALQRHTKGGTIAAISDDINQIQVKHEDFLTALDEVKPLFGVSEEVLEKCVRLGIIHFGPHIDKILSDGRAFVKQVRTGTTDLYSVLLHGPRGSGKTALAARIALDSQFPFAKMIRQKDVVGMNEIQKTQYIVKIFEDAYKSPLNILILDRIELLIDWSPVGPRFSGPVLAALKGMMENHPPEGRPLLIMATTSNYTVLQQLELFFDAEIPVPNLQTQDELARVMEASGEFDRDMIERGINEIESTTGTQRINVSINEILTSGVQTAMQEEDRVGKFAEVVSKMVNRNIVV